MSVLDIDFEDDEHITEMTIHTVKYGGYYSKDTVLAKIQVRTNQGKIYAAGGGKNLFTRQLGLDDSSETKNAVIGFSGNYGEFINQFKVQYVDLNEFPITQVSTFLGNTADQDWT